MANMQPQYGMQMPAYGQMYYPTNVQPIQMVPQQTIQQPQFTGKNQNGGKNRCYSIRKLKRR